MAAEANLQSSAKRYAKKIGWRAYKFSSPGNAGVPDMIFIYEKNKAARIWFVEFKAPGKEPTELQEDVMGEFIKCGFDVSWFDSLKLFKKALDARTKRAANSRHI